MGALVPLIISDDKFVYMPSGGGFAVYEPCGFDGFDIEQLIVVVEEVIIWVFVFWVGVAQKERSPLVVYLRTESREFDLVVF